MWPFEFKLDDGDFFLKKFEFVQQLAKNTENINFAFEKYVIELCGSATIKHRCRAFLGSLLP